MLTEKLSFESTEMKEIFILKRTTYFFGIPIITKRDICHRDPVKDENDAG